MYQLALHPEKQEILHQEVSAILPNSETKLTNEKFNQMSYLKACIKETLRYNHFYLLFINYFVITFIIISRMYPVVISNGRCTSRDCVIGGYQIPEGVSSIFLN